MNIFLTGEIQIGKSTVINKVLNFLNVDYGGFKTYFDSNRESCDKILYLSSAAEPKMFTEDNVVVRFHGDCPPEVLNSKFDTNGVRLIKDARLNSKLILMDECGRLEADAFKFQHEILDALSGNKPVFGALKKSDKGWTDSIRNHPNVKLITVTRENRDYLPEKLANYFVDMLGCNPRMNFDNQ